MPEDDRQESNPLLERAEALRRRQQDAAHNEDVPVLTEMIEDEGQRRPAVDGPALEALARELERAVLERLAPEVDRVIQEKLAKNLNQVLGQGMDGVRAEITVTVRQMVREAIAASVARALSRTERK